MENKNFGKKKLYLITAAVIILCAIIIAIVLASKGNSTNKKLQTQLNLGNSYMDALDYESAIAAYEEAIRIEPKSEEAYIALANAYIEQGEYEKAIEVLEEGYAQTEATAILDKRDEVMLIGCLSACGNSTEENNALGNEIEEENLATEDIKEAENDSIECDENTEQSFAIAEEEQGGDVEENDVSEEEINIEITAELVDWVESLGKQETVFAIWNVDSQSGYEVKNVYEGLLDEADEENFVWFADGVGNYYFDFREGDYFLISTTGKWVNNRTSLVEMVCEKSIDGRDYILYKVTDDDEYYDDDDIYFTREEGTGSDPIAFMMYYNVYLTLDDIIEGNYDCHLYTPVGMLGFNIPLGYMLISDEDDGTKYIKLYSADDLYNEKIALSTDPNMQLIYGKDSLTDENFLGAILTYEHIGSKETAYGVIEMYEVKNEWEGLSWVEMLGILKIQDTYIKIWVSRDSEETLAQIIDELF